MITKYQIQYYLTEEQKLMINKEKIPIFLRFFIFKLSFNTHVQKLSQSFTSKRVAIMRIIKN